MLNPEQNQNQNHIMINLHATFKVTIVIRQEFDCKYKNHRHFRQEK